MNKKIDKLLEQNARNVANFGTGSKYDLKTKSAFNKAWSNIKRQIKEIDKKFYEVIKGQDD
jgi:hypothetical protein